MKHCSNNYSYGSIGDENVGTGFHHLIVAAIATSKVDSTQCIIFNSATWSWFVVDYKNFLLGILASRCWYFQIEINIYFLLFTSVHIHIFSNSVIKINKFWCKYWDLLYIIFLHPFVLKIQNTISLRSFLAVISYRTSSIFDKILVVMFYDYLY